MPIVRCAGTSRTRTDANGAATVALCAGTGTSLSRWLIAWVGDCRVYRVSPRNPAYRHSCSRATTPIDTWGSNRRAVRPSTILSAWLATEPSTHRMSAPLILARDEMLLLCSDGVHKHAGPSDIARLLRGTVPLVARCAQLVDFVRERGSRDDATVLVVHRDLHARPRRFVRLVALATLIAVGCRQHCFGLRPTARPRSVFPTRSSSTLRWGNHDDSRRSSTCSVAGGRRWPRRTRRGVPRGNCPRGAPPVHQAFSHHPRCRFRALDRREWRILARLIGHGIRCVPDVVQFDGGAQGAYASCRPTTPVSRSINGRR